MSKSSDTYSLNSKAGGDNDFSNLDENKSSLHNETQSLYSENISSSIDQENKSKVQNLIGSTMNVNFESYEELKSLTVSSKLGEKLINQIVTSKQNKDNESDGDFNETQLNDSDSNPIILLNKQNRDRVISSYQESMKSSLKTKKIQEVPLATIDEYDYVIYQPEMLKFEDLERHFEMPKSEYDRITQTCELLDQLLGQKIEFQIAPYEKESIFSTIIFDMNKSDLRYFYKGCIDMEAYEERKVIIPHGPGTRYKSTGQFQQGMF